MQLFVFSKINRFWKIVINATLPHVIILTKSIVMGKKNFFFIKQQLMAILSFRLNMDFFGGKKILYLIIQLDLKSIYRII
jgi:hypothetical protein